MSRVMVHLDTLATLEPSVSIRGWAYPYIIVLYIRPLITYVSPLYIHRAIHFPLFTL